MPYYFFTVIYAVNLDETYSKKRGTKNAGGIKHLDERDIDKVWHHWGLKYKAHYGANFVSFDVVQISKRSQVYKDWVEKKIKD